jgi:hypothetical protein
VSGNAPRTPCCGAPKPVVYSWNVVALGMLPLDNMVVVSDRRFSKFAHAVFDPNQDLAKEYLNSHHTRINIYYVPLHYLSELFSDLEFIWVIRQSELELFPIPQYGLSARRPQCIVSQFKDLLQGWPIVLGPIQARSDQAFE